MTNPRPVLNEDGIDSPFGAQLLMAELWYESAPSLSDETLLARLRELLPDSEIESQDSSILIPHPEVTIEMEDGTVPLLTSVFAASDLGHEGKQKPDTSQTWDFDGADLALERCTGSLLVTELLARFFTPPQRVQAIRQVISALIEATKPSAISWPNSQLVSSPEVFDDHPTDGIINVRFFKISDDPGAIVMDTLGLDVFELSDLQCHFRDVDPSQIAAMLYNTARYVFEAGDVIDDGHTVPGVSGDERYPCRHEDSLLEPSRPIIDVDLGEPYAVDHRERLSS